MYNFVTKEEELRKLSYEDLSKLVSKAMECKSVEAALCYQNIMLNKRINDLEEVCIKLEKRVEELEYKEKDRYQFW